MYILFICICISKTKYYFKVCLPAQGTHYWITAMRTMETFDKEACGKLKKMDNCQFTYN